MSRTVWNAGGAIAALGRPPDATTPKPAEEGAIFHALLDAGVEAKLPYTAEKRMHSMTSETVAE
ncbi:MAG: hypothetical protein OXI65_13235, partial [Acidobacteriota bacterium]|nr:hypothetical protein [Acidobacteriota bacterium]